MVKGVIYQSRRGLLLRNQWRGRTFDDANGKVLLVTAESYNNAGDCEAAMRKSCPGIDLWIKRNGNLTRLDV